MKKIYIFSLFILAIFFSNAQDSSFVKKIGINAGLSTNSNWHTDIDLLVIYNCSFTGSFGKHSVFIGPLFARIYADRPSPLKKPLSMGLQAGYRFYPFGKGKKLNWFAEYDFNYVSRTENGEGEVFDDWNGTYVYSTSYRSYSDHLFSAGFDLNFLKCFYFYFSAGTGFEWSQNKITEKYNSGYEWYYDSGKVKATVPPLFVKTGLGFSFLNMGEKK